MTLDHKKKDFPPKEECTHLGCMDAPNGVCWQDDNKARAEEAMRRAGVRTFGPNFKMTDLDRQESHHLIDEIRLALDEKDNTEKRN